MWLQAQYNKHTAHPRLQEHGLTAHVDSEASGIYARTHDASTLARARIDSTRRHRSIRNLRSQSRGFLCARTQHIANLRTHSGLHGKSCHRRITTSTDASVISCSRAYVETKESGIQARRLMVCSVAEARKVAYMASPAIDGSLICGRIVAYMASPAVDG